MRLNGSPHIAEFEAQAICDDADGCEAGVVKVLVLVGDACDGRHEVKVRQVCQEHADALHEILRTHHVASWVGKAQ